MWVTPVLDWARLVPSPLARVVGETHLDAWVHSGVREGHHYPHRPRGWRRPGPAAASRGSSAPLGGHEETLRDIVGHPVISQDTGRDNRDMGTAGGTWKHTQVPHGLDLPLLEGCPILSSWGEAWG